MSKAKTTEPAPAAPSVSEVLERAAALLKERGWKAASAGDPTPFGLEAGPLTLNQALWRGGCVGDRVDPLAVGAAAKALCRMIDDRDAAPRFVQLSLWAKQPSRTERDVIALLRITAAALRESVARPEAALEGEDDE